MTIKNGNNKYEISKDSAKGEFKQKVKDTEITANAELAKKDGRTDLSVRVGQMTNGKDGKINGQEYGASLSYIDDGKKKGVGASVDSKITTGTGYKDGKKEITNTHTTEDKLSGEVTKDKKGNIEGKGSYEHSDTDTRKVAIGKASASQSTKTYHNTDVSVKVNTQKGKESLTVGGSHTNGIQYSAGAQFGDHLSAEASAGRSQTIGGQLHADRHGVSAQGSYEQKYNAQANVKVGNLKIGASGEVGDKTFGGASITGKNGQVNIKANIGKEYTAKGEIKVGDKTLASVDGSAKGEVNAGVTIGKNKVGVQAGVDAEAKAKVAFGQTEVKVDFKIDFHIGISFDFKTGLHFDIGGGISAEISVKDTKTGKETKLLSSPGTPSYILYRKRRIGKKNMKKSQKNKSKILGQACRPSRR